MGKGDKKTKRGKITIGSFGKRRLKKTKSTYSAAVKETVKKATEKEKPEPKAKVEAKAKVETKPKAEPKKKATSKKEEPKAKPEKDKE